MERYFYSKQDFDPDRSLHRCVGVSKMDAAYTMSIAEVVKRFTLPLQEEVMSKSLLTYDYTVDNGLSSLSDDQLLDMFDVTSVNIDFTDLERTLRYARAQAESSYSDVLRQQKEKEAAMSAAQLNVDKSEQITVEQSVHPKSSTIVQ